MLLCIREGTCLPVFVLSDDALIWLLNLLLELPVRFCHAPDVELEADRVTTG